MNYYINMLHFKIQRLNFRERSYTSGISPGRESRLDRFMRSRVAAGWAPSSATGYGPGRLDALEDNLITPAAENKALQGYLGHKKHPPPTTLQ